MVMTQIKFSQALKWFIPVCILSCNNSTPAEKVENLSQDTASRTDEVHNIRPVHWSYSQEDGAEGWAKLSPVYAACGSGKSQSPVDLLTEVGKGTVQWKIDYKATSLHIAHNENVQELINNGHTIQVTPEAGSSITYGGKIYQLKQFHFHTPGEHTINGKHFPMEIHLVHESDDKSLAVIGVLFNEGNHNSNFDQL